MLAGTIVAQRLINILPDLETVGLLSRQSSNNFTGYTWTAQEAPGSADEKIESGLMGGDRWKVFKLIKNGQSAEPKEQDQIFDGSLLWILKSQEIQYHRNVFRARALYSNAAAAYAISTASLPDGTHNVSYSKQLATSGGFNSLITNHTNTYALAAGPLPTGLTLSGGGLISGTPTQTGTFPITITATDAIGVVATKTFSLVAS